MKSKSSRYIFFLEHPTNHVKSRPAAHLGVFRQHSCKPGPAAVSKQVPLHKRTVLTENAKYIDEYPFLQNTGELGELIFQYDWSKTCLGKIEDWPLSLKITLSNILHSAFPMFLFWGKDFLCFYNDAFRPSLGVNGKHPAIGKKAIVVWGEIWHIIGPLIQQVIVSGKPVWFEDQLVPFYRNGRVEDIYWTFSYSPAFGEENEVKGVLVTCMETTKSVLARREKESD